MLGLWDPQEKNQRMFRRFCDQRVGLVETRIYGEKNEKSVHFGSIIQLLRRADGTVQEQKEQTSDRSLCFEGCWDFSMSADRHCLKIEPPHCKVSRES
jgi:hypothetical protein